MFVFTIMLLRQEENRLYAHVDSGADDATDADTAPAAYRRRHRALRLRGAVYASINAIAPLAINAEKMNQPTLDLRHAAAR